MPHVFARSEAGVFHALGQAQMASHGARRSAPGEWLIAYGNATQPGSPHVGDPLELFACNEMRPVWRSRSDIEADLELRETLEQVSPKTDFLAFWHRGH